MKNQSTSASRKTNPNEAYYYARERLQIVNDPDSTVVVSNRVKLSLEKTLKNNRRPAASVRLALWEQRQKKHPLFQKSNSYTSHILEEKKSKEGSGLRVYLERAFSEPEDYQFPIQPLNQEQRREALKYIIINPSRIPDGIFLEMSGMEIIDWMSMSSTERMEKKRAYIPLLKELFFESHPLMTRHNGVTGRVVRLPFHQEMPKVAGSYLVFQETSYLDTQRITRREPRLNAITTKIVPDIWSLARSQKHATEALTKKIEHINFCMAELVALRVDYPGYQESDRRAMVSRFMSHFDRKQGFAFRKILNIRKPKIKYSNAGIDDSIFHGMYNDLEKYLLELVSKRSQIQRQEFLIRNMATTHYKQFSTFFDSLRWDIQAFDTRWLEDKILHTSSSNREITFSPTEASKIGKIWHQVRCYGNILSEPSMIGAPFFEIESRVVQSLKAIKTSTPIVNVRELYKLVRNANLTMCQTMLFELQDLLSTGEYESQATTYPNQFEKMISDCESMQFLNRIPSEKLDQAFQQKLSQLKILLQLMKSWDIEELKSSVKQALEK